MKDRLGGVLHKPVAHVLGSVVTRADDVGHEAAELGSGPIDEANATAEFLAEMERVVPWTDLIARASRFMPEGRRGRPPFPVEVMLRVHFMQMWLNLSDPAMEDALHGVPLFRDFAGLDGWDDRLLDESTILRFRHVLEKHKLAPEILKTVNVSAPI